MSILQMLTDELRQAMIDHAAAEQPRECCGLIVRVADDGILRYLAARNIFVGRAGQDRFSLDPDDYAAAEDTGTVLAVVHSHPNASANPSMADRVGCEKSGLPWVVVGWPSGVMKELAPEGWQAPYKGREFAHGVLDCYTLIQDWYWRELHLTLPDFEREDDWWLKGQDLYMQGFAEAGFVQVQGQPQRHDVVLMQVASAKANHGAIYLGGDKLLHHLWARLSCEDVYGGYWLRHTGVLLRHRSLI
jgi:proteasome lid subunit RPN8/RPN11